MARDVWRETMDAIDADRRDEAPDIMRDDSDDGALLEFLV